MKLEGLTAASDHRSVKKRSPSLLSGKGSDGRRDVGVKTADGKEEEEE